MSVQKFSKILFESNRFRFAHDFKSFWLRENKFVIGLFYRPALRLYPPRFTVKWLHSKTFAKNL